MKTKLTTLSLAVLLAIGTLPAANASLVAGDIGAGLYSLNDINTTSGPDGSIGWSFSVNSDVNIGALGYFNGGTALTSDHIVDIFTQTGSQIGTSDATLIASATISNSNSTLTGGFNWVALSNTVSLQTGQEYYIEATTGNDPYAYATAASSAKWLNFNTNNYYSGTTDVPVFPDSAAGPGYDLAFFGGNLAVVPEPGSIALLSIGMLGLGFTSSRRIKFVAIQAMPQAV